MQWDRWIEIGEREYQTIQTDHAYSLSGTSVSYKNAVRAFTRAVGLIEAGIKTGDADISLLIPVLRRLIELTCQSNACSDTELSLASLLAVVERQMGSGNIESLQILNKLAELAYDCKDFKKASLHCRKIVSINKRIFGCEHIEVTNSEHHLAVVCHASGDYIQSETLFSRVLALKTRLLGHYSPEVAAVLRDYAALLGDMGRSQEAANLLMCADLIKVDY